MSKSVNIKELSKYLNLSVTTISRVLNGKAKEYRISEKTCEKVLKAAKELNYIPNTLARGLKLSKTDTIGLLVPNISNPFFADLSKSIEKEASQKGYLILLCDSDENQQNEIKLLETLKKRKVDGIIIAPVGLESSHIQKLHRENFPLVVIDRYFPDINVPYVTSDNFQGAYNAVEYLIKHGHKKIACIQGLPNSQPNKDRVRGYLEALKTYNLPIENSLILGDSYSEENGYIQTRLLFSFNSPPDAIFALSNLIALGVIKAAKEMNLNIPDDFSLISFDEQPYSAFLTPSLTTIEQQRNEIGKLAVNILLKFIQDSNIANNVNVKIATRLIERNSVKLKK